MKVPEHTDLHNLPEENTQEVIILSAKNYSAACDFNICRALGNGKGSRQPASGRIRVLKMGDTVGPKCFLPGWGYLKIAGMKGWVVCLEILSFVLI